MNTEIFRSGDKVYYTGTKYRSRLAGKIGWLTAPVNNEPGMWVLEFPDTRNPKDPTDVDDFLMPESVLTKLRPASVSPEKKEGPEVSPRRRRGGEDT